MTLRGSALACRLLLVLYISHRLGLAAMAQYGFLVGSAAVLTAVSGFGLNVALSRICVSGDATEMTRRLRDRMLQRLLVQVPLLTIAVACLTHGPGADLPPAALAVLMLEPIVTDVHEAFVFRRYSVFGNLTLFLRSASWIPVVVAVGLVWPAWQDAAVVLDGWAAGLVLTILVALAWALRSAEVRCALAEPIDWRWIVRSTASWPTAYLSDIGYAGLLYSDRFIVAAFLGERAAGRFVFLWSITNAIVPVVQAGVFNHFTPRMAALWRAGQLRAWLDAFLQARRAATRLAFASGAAVLGAIMVLLPRSNQSQVVLQFATAALMVTALVIRLRGETIHNALYSAERDRDWVTVNIVGLVLGPLLGVAGVALFGFVGGGLQMVAGATVIYLLRWRRVQHVVQQARRTPILSEKTA